MTEERVLVQLRRRRSALQPLPSLSQRELAGPSAQAPPLLHCRSSQGPTHPENCGGRTTKPPSAPGGPPPRIVPPNLGGQQHSPGRVKHEPPPAPPGCMRGATEKESSRNAVQQGHTQQVYHGQTPNL
ncbi:unnamed protein product [Boreogadus saida]